MLSINPVLDTSQSAPSGSSPFVWKYCRMCALQLKHGVYIFGEEGKRLQLPEKIRKTVAILVLEEDTLPKKICTSCCTSLESYVQFKDSVVDAQEKLSSIAKSIEKSQEMLQQQQQVYRSPKRPKLFPHSSSHALVPTPSLVAGEVVPVEEGRDCDTPPSVESHMEEEDFPVTKPVQEVAIRQSMDISPRDDETEVKPVPSRPTHLSLSPSTSKQASSSPPSSSSNLETSPKGPSSSSTDNVTERDGEGGSHLVCGLCNQALNDKMSADEHHVNSHGKDSDPHHNEADPVYGCSSCPRISSNYEAIRQHIYRHRMAGTFKCADCDKSFPTKDQLHVHVSSKHNPDGEKSFLCKTCGNKFGSSIALLAHQRKKHVTDDEHQSEFEATPSKSAVKTKSADASSKPAIPSTSLDKSGEGGFWKCDICDKMFQSKKGYDVHIATHKGIRHTCDHCSISYTQKWTLDHHIKVHHSNLEDSFECSECGKKFKTFRQLGWHKKTHERPLTDLRCPECDKKFMNMISLKSHLKLHRGEKRFACSECSKSFYSKKKLEEHMNSHTGRRPVGCPAANCTKFFSCFSNYAKHFRRHHREQIGPRGKMIPTPKLLQEDNNNLPGKKSVKSHSHLASQVQPQQLNIPSVATLPKSQEPVPSASAPVQVVISSSIERTLPPSQSEPLRPPVVVMETGSQSVPVPATPSFSTTGSQTSAGATSNSNVAYHGQSATFHPTAATSTQTLQDNVTAAHTSNQSSTLVPTPSQHPLPHTSPNSAHSSSSTQTQTQFQLPQPQTQSVWQPVMIPSSKTYHHSSNNASSSLPLLSSFEMLDCPTIVPAAHPSESHHGHHSHQSNLNHLTHGGTTTATLVPVSVVVAHQSHTPHAVSSSGTSLSSSTSHHHHHSSSHLVNVHHTLSSSSSSNSHSTPSSSIPISSNLSVNVPHFVPSSQQQEPMELSYKLDSDNFQEMPMELTKVFQRDPLELCVRQEFGHGQPLMDLSSRVVNVTVGGNMGLSVSNGTATTSSSSGAGTGNQSHYSGASGAVLSVPYHKSVDLIERELTLNDFTGAFRQPIDLISRTDEHSHSHELCSEGNLVDLSLRSSFGQDQTASSFLRELIDLSSRSDSFHGGEVNLTNKSSHLSHHHHHHHHNPNSASSQAHAPPHPHPVSNKQTPAVAAHHGSNGSHSGSHHTGHHHHHHHHVQSQSHPSSNSSANTVSLQNVILPDLNFSSLN